VEIAQNLAKAKDWLKIINPFFMYKKLKWLYLANTVYILNCGIFVA